MGSFLDLFAPIKGAMVIFKLGFIPTERDFLELTSEQYQKFYDTAPDADNYLNETLYMFLPEDTQKYAEFASGAALVLSEKDIATIKSAEDLIEKYCADSGQEFANLEEKLCYCASVMPSVATDGTKYEKFQRKWPSKHNGGEADARDAGAWTTTTRA